MAIITFEMQEASVEYLQNLQSKISNEIERRKRIEIDALIRNFEAAFRALHDAHVVVRYVNPEDEIDVYIKDEDDFWYE